METENIFNDCIESDDGTWEYFREVNSPIYELHYYKLDQTYPIIKIQLTEEEFNDLRTLFKNIDKIIFKNKK